MCINYSFFYFCFHNYIFEGDRIQWNEIKERMKNKSRNYYTGKKQKDENEMKLWNCVKLRAYTHALNGYERKEGKCTDTTWWRVWRTLSSRMCVIQIWIVFKRDYFFCKIIFKKLQLIIFSLFSSVLLWFFLHAKHKCSSKLYVIIHLILLVLYNALLKRHQGKSLSINVYAFTKILGLKIIYSYSLSDIAFSIGHSYF